MNYLMNYRGCEAKKATHKIWCYNLMLTHKFVIL